MRRILLPLLVVVAVPLYVWDVYQVVRSGSSGTTAVIPALSGTSRTSFGGAAPGARAVHFVASTRSPFEPYASVVVAPRPAQPTTSTSAGASQPATPPPLTVTGIMWNAQNPVAMISLPDGSSTMAKPGQTVGSGILVKKVEQQRILVVYGGKEFWISK